MKKIIKWILLVIWLIVIFIFSHQPHSGATTHNIIKNIIPSINNNYINTINILIRKLAHITEYLVLSMLTISLLQEYTKNKKIILIINIIFCFLYACSDEFHQSFVIGRTSNFTDILIDTIGCLIGTTIHKSKKDV